MGEGAYIRRWEAVAEDYSTHVLWHARHSPQMQVVWRRAVWTRRLVAVIIVFPVVFVLMLAQGYPAIRSLWVTAFAYAVSEVFILLLRRVRGHGWQEQFERRLIKSTERGVKKTGRVEFPVGPWRVELEGDELRFIDETRGDQHVFLRSRIERVDYVEDMLFLVEGGLMRGSVPMHAFESEADAAWFIGQLGDGTLTLPDDDGV